MADAAQDPLEGSAIELLVVHDEYVGQRRIPPSGEGGGRSVGSAAKGIKRPRSGTDTRRMTTQAAASAGNDREATPSPAPGLVLIVDDAGPGIPPADRERVWRPFVRLEGGDRPRTGTGIGLAIVRQLVELHEGTTTIQDAPGGGARFVVSLPAAAARGPALHAPSSERIA